MSTKIFYTQQELHTLREIRRISKDKTITDVNKLQQRLKERGIKVTFDKDKSNGKVKSISFEKDTLKVDSVKANDRVWTDRVLNSVDKNREQMIKEMNSPKVQNDRFEEIRRTREERTKMQEQSMYNNKGLER